MLKKLLSLSIIILLFSCQKSKDTGKPEANFKLPIPRDRTKMSSGDGMWDHLGYGYDVTKEYESSSAATFPVINVESLRAAYPTVVQPSLAENGGTFFSYAQNHDELEKKIAITNKFTGGDGMLFKGTIELNFNSTDKWSTKYVYAIYSVRINKRRVYVMKDLALLKSHLQQKFIDDVNTKSASEIISLYGTHVLLDIVLGGKMDLIYQAETNNTDRVYGAKIGAEVSFLKVFSTNSAAQYDQVGFSKNFNQTITAKTVGGASEQSLYGITIGADGNASAQITNISGWQAGITDSNAELVGIKSLIPIYDLIDDPGKKAALQTQISSYLANKSSVIFSPDNVYQYINTRTVDHYYTIRNEGAQTGQNGAWGFEMVAFKAYTSNIEGSTVPIYVYYNAADADHYYTTTYAGASTGGGGKWKYEKVAYYAYSTQVPGSVPVYEYYSNPDSDHYYTTTHQGPNIGAWQYYGIAFYAMPRF